MFLICNRESLLYNKEAEDEYMISRYLIGFIFLCILFFNLAQTLYTQKDKYFFNSTYSENYQKYKDMYYDSQYTKKNPKNIISDDIFESFAAGAFLQGMNPIHITHDHPPMGRYLVALSIYFFNNQHIIILPCLFFVLLGLFLITKTIIKNSFIALIPIGIFANEPLFLNKIVNTPLLEPLQFPFIVFAMYFFIKGMKDKRYIYWFIATSVMLGFVISTRFFVTGFAVIFCMIITLFFFIKPVKKRLITFLITLPLAFIILLISYTKTMMDGYSVIQIIGVQKYILAYHKSKFILPFSFWDLLLLNRWHTWWGKWEISSDPQWIIFWPISMILSVAAAVFGIGRKIKLQDEEKFLLLWIMTYSLMLSTGYTSTNYFLPLIPFLYIISVSFLLKLYNLKRKRNT